MRRDDLLLAEIVVAIERIIEITTNSSSPEIEVTRDRRDSLLWNFTVLGEAANQVSSELKAQHPEVPWQMPAGPATGSCMATGRSTSRSLEQSPVTIYRRS